MADAAANAIHHSVIAKNTIITPCRTVMLAKPTIPSIVHAVAGDAERAEHCDHACKHDAQRRPARASVRRRRRKSCTGMSIGRSKGMAPRTTSRFSSTGEVSAGRPSI